MRRQVKRFILITCTAIVVCCSMGCAKVMCDEEVIAKARQPGGPLTATTLVRNCGATTDFATIVTVQREGSNGNSDDVLAINGRATLTVAWQGATRLVISCPGCSRQSIVRQMSISGNVDVVMELQSTGSR
jgi:hypothetical protein